MERDCRKEVDTVVALSNSEGQTAGGTREKAGRVGVTKKAETLVAAAASAAAAAAAAQQQRHAAAASSTPG